LCIVLADVLQPLDSHAGHFQRDAGCQAGHVDRRLPFLAFYLESLDFIAPLDAGVERWINDHRAALIASRTVSIGVIRCAEYDLSRLKGAVGVVRRPRLTNPQTVPRFTVGASQRLVIAATNHDLAE